MGFLSPPKPTSPKATAQQQMAVNRDTAQLGAQYNRINQYDPFGGSVTYDPATGAQRVGLGDMGQQYAGGLSSLGQQYFGMAGQGVPDSSGAFDQAYQYASANLEPRFERTRAATENRLRNQGLDPTSAAYKSQMNDLALQQNEARNNLVTGLQGQMFNQGLQSRQQTLGELQPGLAFGNNVLSPQTMPFAQVGTGQTPNMGALTQNYDQQRMNNYQGMMGGLAGIGGALLTAPLTGGTSLAGLGMQSFGNIMQGNPYNYGRSWAPSVSYG